MWPLAAPSWAWLTVFAVRTAGVVRLPVKCAAKVIDFPQ